mgnify:CR=1 FL=1|tara:strand:- start:670 stop:807 length:138 start_codon:yes stop_codon:yes gene_type:complete
MRSEEILQELDEVVIKLKMKLMYYETENKELRKRINELKKYVKEK